MSAATEPKRAKLRWRGFLRIIRPHQWTKNGFCFAGLVFGGKWTDPESWFSACVLFLVFCAAASCVYIINDVRDLERDKVHPLKRFRPLPSGDITRNAACLLALILAPIALLSCLVIDPRSYGCLILYLALNLCYSHFLKHMVLIDVAVIAIGFVTRMLAGVYVVNESPTTWITLCTFCLALFLGFGKRRAELGEAADSSSPTRPVLSKYNRPYLDSLVNNAATMTIITYALFTVGSGKNPTLIVTVPFVYIGIMYYTLLVSRNDVGEEPDRILLHSRPLQICIILWLFTYLLITRSNLRLFH